MGSGVEGSMMIHTPERIASPVLLAPQLMTPEHFERFRDNLREELAHEDVIRFFARDNPLMMDLAESIERALDDIERTGLQGVIISDALAFENQRIAGLRGMLMDAHVRLLPLANRRLELISLVDEIFADEGQTERYWECMNMINATSHRLGEALGLKENLALGLQARLNRILGRRNTV